MPSNVTATCSIEVRFEVTETDVYTVFGKQQNLDFDTLEEAIEAAQSEAQKAAESEAVLRGAVGGISVTTEVSTKIVESNFFNEIFLGATVTATAVGRVMV